MVNPPNWITAVFWAYGSRLGILNSYKNELSLYNPSGTLYKRIERRDPIEAVTNYNGKLLAKGHDDTFFFLNSDMNSIESSFTLPGFGSLYSGWIVNHDEIVAYGSIKIPHQQGNPETRNFKLGFLRINIGRRSTDLVLPFENNRFYLSHQQYIAASKGDTYVLAIDAKAIIYRLPSGHAPVPLKSIPAEYSLIPPFRDYEGMDSSKRRFAQLETLRMPVGLYAQGDFIYLLVREPEGCSPWLLFKINPTADRLIGSVPLPTFARHLALIPGDQQWLMIEKGAVLGAGSQVIKSIQAVPTSWIADLETSPLRLRAGLNNCLNGG